MYFAYYSNTHRCTILFWLQTIANVASYVVAVQNVGVGSTLYKVDARDVDNGLWGSLTYHLQVNCSWRIAPSLYIVDIIQTDKCHSIKFCVIEMAIQ